jgi:parvulin-like peptidyl-prolyl isomerase
MQSYESHAHHPVPTYLASAFWLAAAIAFVGAAFFQWNTQTWAFGLLLAAVLVNISVGRVYTTKLQDRIIMLEMKVRCAEVLAAGDDARLGQLSPKQIVALRFASDAELASLLDRAVRERMSPDDIKKAVREWRTDPHRT